MPAQFFDERLRPSDWRKIQPCPVSGCWLWVGAQLPSGYGSVGVIGRGDVSQLAHRYVYTRLVGTIPDGLHIDHRCRVRCCVNPAHLEAVTRQVNNERAAKVRADNCTQCPQGHAYGPGNEKRDAGCRTCHNEAARQKRSNWKRIPHSVVRPRDRRSQPTAGVGVAPTLPDDSKQPAREDEDV